MHDADADLRRDIALFRYGLDRRPGPAAARRSGLPRLINRIAHYALSACALANENRVTAEHLPARPRTNCSPDRSRPRTAACWPMPRPAPSSASAATPAPAALDLSV